MTMTDKTIFQPLPEMTVRQLIEQLSECVDWDRKVEIYLPGSRIKLAAVMHHSKRQPKDRPVLIEGNMIELALEDIAMGR